MKHRWLSLAVFAAVGLLGRSACGQATERNLFEEKIFPIEAMSHFAVSDDKLAALTDAQKQAVVEARNDLMAMLQAIQHRGDARKYATQDLVAKYGTSTALAASLIEPETSILAAGVSDFAVGKGTIRLNFFAVVSSEGNIIVSEKTAVLKETDAGWRFAGFE